VKLVTGIAARALGAVAGIPTAAWLLAGVAAVAGWGHWNAHTARTALAEKRTDLAELQAQVERTRADTEAENTRRVEALQEVTRYANQSRARIEADRVAAVRARDELQQRLAATVAAARAASTAGGPPAGDPIGVLADVLSRADERAGVLAAYADRARAAGAACERAYDALTGSPSLP
jgi:hypothetical protein